MLDKIRAGEIVERRLDGGPIVASFRVPSLGERCAVEARIEAAGGAPVRREEVEERRRAALDALPGIDAADRAAFAALLDAEAAAIAALEALPIDATPDERRAAAPSPSLRAQLDRLERALRAADPDYADLHERHQLRWRLALLHAAQGLLAGWSGVVDRAGAPLAFALERGRVADHVLMRVPPDLLVWLGVEAQRLLYPSETEAKNSAAPSGSPDGAASSSATTDRGSSASGTAV